MSLDIGLDISRLTADTSSPLQMFPGAAIAADFTRGLYHANGTKTLDQFVTDARSTEITLPDAAGILQTIPIGQPARTSKGLGVFDSATNRVTHSEDFTAAPWANLTTTINPNAFVAPNGEMTASKLIGNVSSTNMRLQLTLNLTGSTTYTYSIIAKPAEFSNLRVTRRDTNIDAFTHTFDLVVGTSSGGLVKELSDGFLRLSGEITCNITASTGIVFTMEDGATGDGVSGVYIWGAQLEAGMIATPYIPTTGTAVTRAACQPTIVQGPGSIPFPGYVPGPQTGQVSVMVPASATKRVLKRWVMNATDYVELYYASTGAITLESVTGGVSRGLVSVGGRDDGLEHTITYRIDNTIGELTLDVDGEGTEGPELVMNGTFDTGTFGWGGNQGTIAVNAGRLEVTATSTSWAQALYSLSCEVGSTYRLSGVAEAGGETTTATIEFFNGATQSAISGASAGAGPTSMSKRFTTLGSPCLIKVNNFGSVAGRKAWFDNISLRRSSTRTGVTMPVSFTEIDLGHGAVTGQLNGTIRITAAASGDTFDAWR